MTVDQVLDDILRREGWPVVTVRAADRGGLTKGGITLATACEWFKRSLTRQEFEQLIDKATAIQIYRERYAEPYAFIPHGRLMALLVDFAVTSWHDDAIRALQMALGVAVDGSIGSETRGAVFSQDLDEVYKRVYRIRQQKFLHVAFDEPVRDLLRTNPSTQLHNLRGWLNRLSEFV